MNEKSKVAKERENLENSLTELKKAEEKTLEERLARHQEDTEKSVSKDLGLGKPASNKETPKMMGAKKEVDDFGERSRPDQFDRPRKEESADDLRQIKPQAKAVPPAQAPQHGSDIEDGSLN